MSNSARTVAEPCTCLCPPVPEIAIAAQLLADAVSAHLKGNFNHAAELIALANRDEIRKWT